MYTTLASTNWITRFQPNSQARLRMFCFPYAGAGASIFYNWQNKLASDIEVCAIQLPGRETRLGEPLLTELPPLVETLATALLPYLDTPFIFFGHSMGALISFEVARLLRRKYHKSPQHLFVSGRRAPQIMRRRSPIHHLPDSLFIEELRRYNGTPEAVLQNKELLSLFLPILRADFTINDSYIYTDDIPIDCPILAFGGLEDAGVTSDDIAAWRVHTNSNFSMYMFPGEHFFIKHEYDKISSIIEQKCTERQFCVSTLK
ncbi:thioesterase II family protein [Fortiea contorta]|uniref:thioesterase II family protein n=1 Tax=Fortiea contorta TaxID=1892405 RepID=UPI00034A8446|nr:thioesterase II family protein [Fortiea contorta]